MSTDDGNRGIEPAGAPAARGHAVAAARRRPDTCSCLLLGGAALLASLAVVGGLGVASYLNPGAVDAVAAKLRAWGRADSPPPAGSVADFLASVPRPAPTPAVESPGPDVRPFLLPPAPQAVFEAQGELTTVADAAAELALRYLRLSVPAGALPAGTTLRVGRLEQADAALHAALRAPGASLPLGPIFEVRSASEHVRLARPATVTMPLPALGGGDATALADAAIATLDPATGQWQRHPTRLDAAAGTAIAEVPHFSLFALVAGPVALVAVAGLVANKTIHWEYVTSSDCVLSRESRFSVCWTTSGEHAPALLPDVEIEAPTTGGSREPTIRRRVPVYVQTLLASLERTAAFVSGAPMGFRVPSKPVVVIVKSLPPGRDAEMTVIALSRIDPYVAISNTLSPAKLETSAPHEYFHICQQLYKPYDGAWMREASAVALESEVFPWNHQWLVDYYGRGTAGLAELDTRLDPGDWDHGYLESLFVKYVVRTRGPRFLTAFYESYGDRPFLPAFEAAARGGPGIGATWKEFGRVLVEPDMGGFLGADERALVARRELHERFERPLRPAAPGVALQRANRPFSAVLYRLRAPRDVLGGASPPRGPVFVRFAPGSDEDGLYVSRNRLASPTFAAADQQRIRTLGDGTRNKAWDVGTFGSGGEAIDQLYLWLVDSTVPIAGDRSEGWTELDGNEVWAFWLLPPAGLQIARAGTDWRLSWRETPLRAWLDSTGAARFAGYDVYRRLRGPGATVGSREHVAHVERPGLDVASERLVAGDSCVQWAVTARVSGVEGRDESEPSAWVGAAPETAGFTVTGTVREQGEAFAIAAEAHERLLGVRELEVVAIAGGREVARERQVATPESLRPGSGLQVSWQWTPAGLAAGTEARLVARARVLPTGHACYDRTKHELEREIGRVRVPQGRGAQGCTFRERRQRGHDVHGDGGWQVEVGENVLQARAMGQQIVYGFTPPPRNLTHGQTFTLRYECNAPHGYMARSDLYAEWQTTTAEVQMMTWLIGVSGRGGCKAQSSEAGGAAAQRQEVQLELELDPYRMPSPDRPMLTLTFWPHVDRYGDDADYMQVLEYYYDCR